MVTIKTVPGRLELEAPYHPTLPFRAKQIGGKWLGSKIGWAFPLEEERALRTLCLDIWAVDGSPACLQDMVDLQITVDERAPIRSVFLAYEKPIYLVGREIAAALKNRRAARAGRGVRFLSGKPRCFVTPSIWTVTIPNGSVFIIRDVPAGAIDRFRKTVDGAGEIEVSAAEQRHTLSRDELLRLEDSDGSLLP